MVSTLDFESSDPSSNLGGTFSFDSLGNKFFFSFFRWPWDLVFNCNQNFRKIGFWRKFTITINSKCFGAFLQSLGPFLFILRNWPPNGQVIWKTVLIGWSFCLWELPLHRRECYNHIKRKKSFPFLASELFKLAKCNKHLTFLPKKRKCTFKSLIQKS